MPMRHFFRFSLAAAMLLTVSCADDDVLPDQGSCVPLTCADEQRECGAMANGCGGVASCGSCPDGQECIYGMCRVKCVRDCANKCGGDDGCEGTCADNCYLTGQLCDNELHECVGDCVPGTCATRDAQCGIIDDLCGGELDCGKCLPGSSCESGRCTAIPGDGLGRDCEFNVDACGETFPYCLKLTGEGAFCTAECVTDGQCGTLPVNGSEEPIQNCCVPIGNTAYCIPADLTSYMCEDPTDPSWCTNSETCLPSPLGSCLFCFPMGNGREGEPCDSFNTCDKALGCVRPTGETTSTCRVLCDPSNLDACLDGETPGHCQADSTLGKWGYCVDGAADCDPGQLGSDCPTGWICAPDKADCTSFSCMPSGNRKVGESCTDFSDCVRGAYCNDSVCARMCTATVPCPDNHECVQGCSTKIKYCKAVGGNACNPVTPGSSCLQGQTCAPKGLENCSVGACFVAGKGAAGTSCESHSDCLVDHVCLDTVCRRLCSLTKACTDPEFCFFACGGYDLGVCMSG